MAVPLSLSGMIGIYLFWTSITRRAGTILFLLSDLFVMASYILKTKIRKKPDSGNLCLFVTQVSDVHPVAFKRSKSNKSLYFLISSDNFIRKISNAPFSWN
jgi:hypothetical protein